MFAYLQAGKKREHCFERKKDRLVNAHQGGCHRDSGNLSHRGNEEETVISKTPCPLILLTFALVKELNTLLWESKGGKTPHSLPLQEMKPSWNYTGWFRRIWFELKGPGWITLLVVKGQKADNQAKKFCLNGLGKIQFNTHPLRKIPKALSFVSTPDDVITSSSSAPYRFCDNCGKHGLVRQEMLHAYNPPH